MADKKHVHRFRPVGNRNITNIGNERVTWQRMECDCGEVAENKIIRREKIK